MSYHTIESLFDDPQSSAPGNESEEASRACRDAQVRAAPERRGLALTDAEREEARREANRMLGVKHDYIVAGGRDAGGKLKLKEEPSNKIEVISDARQLDECDTLVADMGTEGPTEAVVAAAFNLPGVEGEPYVRLHPLEQRIQRKDEARILSTRRLIEMALSPSGDYRTIAAECLYWLPRARDSVRETLAAWAAANLRALGYARATILALIGEAAGCKADTVKRLIARGDAGIAAERREAERAVNRTKRAAKPDLREITIGSVFDGEASAQAIARLEAEQQRRLMRAIEKRFTRGAIAADDERAEQARLRSISFGMECRLDEIGRYDISTRTLLGRLNSDTAQRLIEIWVSAHADSLSGFPPAGRLGRGICCRA
ncbi:hypothetical protein ACVWWG_000124 [Bradyrhizobium sp. LB7.2]